MQSILMSLNWWKKPSSLFILLVFLASCSGKYSEEKIQLEMVVKAITKTEPNHKIQAYVLIPNVGCTGCIGVAEQFMLNNVAKMNNVLFILTGINSPKAFKIRYREALKSPYVLADYENIANTKELKSIYPKIFYLEKGEIVRIVESSPEAKGDVWTELKKHLSE